MEEVSLYIHIPFCAKKCMYCDFPSFCGKESLMLDYAKALSNEIQDRAYNKRIKTIFVGGGTPTYLSLKAWEIIKTAIDGLNKDDYIEFTVECNPGTITKEKLELLKLMGVNRLSIGLQAWQNKLLQALGRIHSLDQFLEGYDLVRSEGFNNINVDLMFGLPGQTLYDWKETLRETEALQPEHISTYSLIVEEGTPFYNLSEQGKLILPDEEIEREMNDVAINMLAENGYKQYEISNFAKSGKECRHNIVYWKLENYLGCGAAAHSYVNGTRYRNEENIEKYIEVINSTCSAIVETICNSVDDEIEEFMFMGLRLLDGICEKEFLRRFGRRIEEVYGEVIIKHEKNGLMKKRGERIFLTGKGIELSNSVMSDFIL